MIRLVEAVRGTHTRWYKQEEIEFESERPTEELIRQIQELAKADSVAEDTAAQAMFKGDE